MEKKDWSILFAIAILLLALGTTLFFIAQRKKQVSLQLFNTRIERIDGYIRDGNRSKALEEILDLADKDLSASSYIRLLKRVWEESFPGYGRDYELLAELSAKAHSQYPGSAELRALASYSLLRTGSEVEAARIFFEDPPPADRWDALRKELSLYLPPEQKDETSTGIADLGMDSDPEVFIDFYSDTGNPGFLTNALLVELRRGRIDDAYRLAQRYRNEKLPGKLLLFLHYDAGQWDGALELLERYPQMFPKEEHLLLTADIYMRQGDYEAARDVYWRLMPSFDALYNTLYIDLVQGKNDPMEMIDRWWNEETPGEGRMIELAELLLAEGDPESAEQLLDRLDAGKERAAAVSLLRERSRERINPARYSSLLWTLLYQEEEEKYAVHLSWFLMGIGDAAGLHNLIEYGEKKFGRRYWIYFSKAFVKMYQEDYASAAELFESSYELKPHWASLYNASLAYLGEERFEQAERALERAELSLLEEEGEYLRERAKILLKRVELAIHRNQREQAEDLLLRIRELDPDNIRATILRSLLSD